MLSEAAAISDSITSSSLHAPWSEVESESSGRIIADLMTCSEKALDRCRVVKDTSEPWYALGAVRPWSVESSSQYGVRISTVIEEGQVDYAPVVALFREVAGHSRQSSSPRKGKKEVSRSPIRLPGQFEVSSPSAKSRKRALVDDPTFASELASESLRGKSRKSGRDGKAAPVLRGGMP